jgi:hypothetical protein
LHTFARGTRTQEVIAMPEPGSKKYDTRRARLRKDAESDGVSDQDANDQANETLQRDSQWRSRGPRTERGRGPKSERGERERSENENTD